MIRRPPRSTLDRSSAASDVYKRQVVEVAVSCVLLVVSGLMVRSIVQNSRLSYPFATEDVFFGALNLDDQSFPTVADVGRRNVMVEERLSQVCLLYTSPSPRDRTRSRMPSSA